MQQSRKRRLSCVDLLCDGLYCAKEGCVGRLWPAYLFVRAQTDEMAAMGSRFASAISSSDPVTCAAGARINHRATFCVAAAAAGGVPMPLAPGPQWPAPHARHLGVHRVAEIGR